MLVVLYKSARLFEVFTAKMCLELYKLIVNYWYLILSNDYSLHLDTSKFCVPLVSSNI